MFMGFICFHVIFQPFLLKLSFLCGHWVEDMGEGGVKKLGNRMTFFMDSPLCNGKRPIWTPLLKWKHTANRGWVPKFATGLIHQIRHSSKIMKVIKLSFGQNDPPMRELFWQNNSLVTHILFELCSIWYISPVANFGTHPLVRHRIFS